MQYGTVGSSGRVPLKRQATKLENDYGSTEAFGSNANLPTRQREVAEWKPVYLDQLFLHSFFQLSYHFW